MGFVAQIDFGDSSGESSMIAGRYEQLGPSEYKATNWSSYTDTLKQRGSLSIWFDPEIT
jgi:hypothetical protein